MLSTGLGVGVVEEHGAGLGSTVQPVLSITHPSISPNSTLTLTVDKEKAPNPDSNAPSPSYLKSSASELDLGSSKRTNPFNFLVSNADSTGTRGSGAGLQFALLEGREAESCGQGAYRLGLAFGLGVASLLK